MNHRSPSPLTRMPNSVPLRAIAVTRLLQGTPWAASSAALHAAMPTFRKKWSFPAAKVRMRSRSAAGMSSAATCGASVLMRSADAARFRLWHSSPIWTAWAIRLRMSTPPIRRSTSPSAGPRTASNHRSRSITSGAKAP